MNLKLVVAMSVLGLVSCPVFAATSAKHKHHTASHQEYKDAGNYKDQPPVEVCTISAETMAMVAMSQNVGRSLPNPCNPGWYNRIQIAGGLNVDVGKFGNRNMNYQGENYQRFSLNDAYINVGAIVNDWAKLFASVSYNTATVNAPNITTGIPAVAEYSAAYANNVTGSTGTNQVQIEQAFATFANFDQSPFFATLGKQFQDFGRYEIHPIERSLTQVMTETLATSLGVGFIVNGFNGQVFAFDDPLSKVGQTTPTTNYGAALGYDAPSEQLGWTIGIGYLYNLIGVNDVAYAVNQWNFAPANPTPTGGYNTRASGGEAHAGINSGPFWAMANYVSALQRFNPLDLPQNGNADTVAVPVPGSTTGATSPVVAGTASGARPWAAGLTVGFGFEAFGCRTNNIYVGYQASRQAAGLNIPKGRWVGGYNIDAFGPQTIAAIEWDHNQDYNTSNGGGQGSSNLVSLRFGVKYG